jgi:hypothetical protein
MIKFPKGLSQMLHPQIPFGPSPNVGIGMTFGNSSMLESLLIDITLWFKQINLSTK